MKKIITFLFPILFGILFATNVFAQSPEKLSYQAVIRNSSNQLVTNQGIGIKVSILQGAEDGNSVYTETHSATTNANGLVTLMIGAGATADDFSSIDWSSDNYYIKTETDPTLAGGTNYSITGVSQLLSVPYALHAKTAESVAGGISETDPTFSAWDKSTGIIISESQISDLGTYIVTESDPDFNASVASGITEADTAKWNTASGASFTESDPVFTSWDKDYADITNTPTIPTNVSDLVNDEGYITDYTETDPVYTASEAANITAADITNLGNLSGTNTGDQDISGIATNTQAIQDTAAQIRADMFDGNYNSLTNIPDLSGYDTDVSDDFDGSYSSLTGTPVTITTVQANAIVANSGKDTTGIYHTNRAALDLVSGTNTGDQNISGIATNTQAIQDTASQIRADIPVNNNQLVNGAGYITGYTETDPSVPAGTQVGEMQYWDGSAWVTLAPAIVDGAILTFSGGIPTWGYELEEGEVINATTGKIWMDSNLGASQVATSSTDYLAYGSLYQWGRASDGHEVINWTSSTGSDGVEQLNETSTLATSNTPGHSNFINNSSSPYDWLSTQDDDLWQGVSGTNNPCPSGFRLPTETEWDAERQSWSSNNASGAFASPLKLPLAGDRYFSGGSIFNVSIYGLYWSSTVFGTKSRTLDFTKNGAYIGSYNRAYGLSVRCIKD